VNELTAEQLRRRVDPAQLPFETTAEVEPLVGTVGQPRAIEAIEFALQEEAPGYNLFVAGLPGSGRATTVRDYIDRVAAGRPTPDDWVYVHNFVDGDRPKAIRLPAGRGTALAQDVEEFLRAARREIPRAFESEEYERRQREAVAEITRGREALTEGLVEFARERGFRLQVTLAGVMTTPLHEGEPLTREAFAALPAEEQRRIESAGAEIREQTETYLGQTHQLEKDAAERLRELDHDVALFVVGPLFHDLRERYADLADVLDYLNAVQADVVGHLDEFRQPEEGALPGIFSPIRAPEAARHRVNVLVGNAEAEGAPVVVEHNPTYYNLLGRIEYRAAFGAMVTDFRGIKAGALHRANGGFLVLEALEVLRHPFAWEALKRALRGRQVKIENLGEEFSAVPTATLRPQPIPLDVKTVLIGSTLLYQLLYQLDEDFRELFKAKADFAPEMDWSDEHLGSYAAFVARRVRERELRHFDRSAVARLLEEGARLRENQQKLSTRLIEIADIVTEASFCAGRDGREIVTAPDVNRAIAAREYRSSLLEERVHELIQNGTIRIDTEGARVGQVNGISILDLGDYRFGRPSRITARVSLGRHGVQSIERETELSGPIHSKGVLTLSGYLASTYAQEWPLAATATITFEQSYDEVEGDSASSAELYALLSALSDLPVAQGIAVTGSVDQLGEIQAVGGVTHKIEGFFAVCKARGLTGEQGVIIPSRNERSLMLSDEVVEAVRAGHFHVWAIRTVDEGIELLTGIPADDVHELACERLRKYAERLQAAWRQEAERDSGVL
jgi:lon-related putative ATP-dependent protease